MKFSIKLFVCSAIFGIISIMFITQVSTGTPGGRGKSSIGDEVGSEKEGGRIVVKAGKDIKSCKFGEKDYMPGQRWSANTTGFTCVICFCLQTGRFNCTLSDCCEEEVGTGHGTNESIKRARGKELSPPGGDVTLRVDGSRVCCTTCAGSGSGGEGGGGDVDGRMGGRYKGRDDGGSFGKMSETTTISSGLENNKETASPSYEIEPDMDPYLKSNMEHVSCLHQGKIYRDKEVFAANMSGLPPISNRAQEHCMHCTCQGGMVLCTMKPCSSIVCRKNVTGQQMDACCDKCKGGDESGKMRLRGRKVEKGGGTDMKDFADRGYAYAYQPTTDPVEHHKSGILPMDGRHPGTALLSLHPLVASGKRAGCVSAGKFYMHGATWHPIIGPFGSMECVNCKCVHGRIDCSRLACSAPSALRCQNLVKLDGYCCPICMGSSTQNELGATRLCAPNYQDVTVYQSQEYFPENETEFASMSFVPVRGDRNSKFEVEIHEWTLQEGKILKFYTTGLTAEDFVQYKKNKNTILLGVTTNRNLEKFTKREKKLHFRCKSQCNIRMKGIQLTLRLHGLVVRDKCLEEERNLF